ncbi:carbohydrate ABC transporter permease [Paenibacillus solisilvae]|uniref:Carbohydrate ABC transporter permease n=1 Tax=Paenibacillus solisilvae TaxID=2486751 RepID=A0ABW0VU39_9BACL
MAVMLKRIIIFGLLLITLLPLVYILLNSFRPQSAFFQSAEALFSGKFTLENYSYLVTQTSALQNLGNSLFITIVSTAAAVLFGSMASFSLSRLSYRFLILISLLIVLVRFYPKISIVIPYYILIRNLHLLDTTWSVILAHAGLSLPLVVLMMSMFYAELPKEVEESCQIDGSPIGYTYFRIIVPITKSGMAAAAILSAQLSWNEFLLASSVTSINSVTLPIVIAGFITDKGTNLGAMAAMSMVIALPVIIFIFAAQRFLVQGLTMGSVKG